MVGKRPAPSRATPGFERSRSLPSPRMPRHRTGMTSTRPYVTRSLPNRSTRRRCSTSCNAILALDLGRWRMDEASTVLIVDEDPFIRDVLTQKLEALGYRTVGARNGKEA